VSSEIEDTTAQSSSPKPTETLSTAQQISTVPPSGSHLRRRSIDESDEGKWEYSPIPGDWNSYAVGDLSGKYGSWPGTLDGKVVWRIADKDMSLDECMDETSANYVGNKAIVVKDVKGRIMGCANLEFQENTIVADTSVAQLLPVGVAWENVAFLCCILYSIVFL
jgi:hypothetical protein